MKTMIKQLVVAGAMIAAASSVTASSVSSMSIEALTDESALIFEGQVTGLQNVTMGSKGARTVVSFEVSDVIKGDPARKTVDLSFLGGLNANGLMMQVTDMHMPEMGERGIYFVENPSARSVHPFTGWDQGHFLLESPVGNKTGGMVKTRAGQPVYELVGGMPVTDFLSSGKAVGVNVTPIMDQAPLSAEEFKIQIREMIR
ncbi:MAG: hypothetical protein ACWA5Q_11225 [bacterium]